MLSNYKILLIATNQEKLPDPVYPLGASYIAAACVNEGLEIVDLDLCFDENPNKSVQEKIKSSNPDIIALSIRNVDTATTTGLKYYMDYYKDLVNNIKKYFQGTIIIGGSGFSIMPKRFMEEMDVDYGVFGEGEIVFPKLVKCIIDNQSAEEIPGIVYRKNGQIHVNKQSYINKTDWISPLRTVFNTHVYYQKGGSINVQTKRGCPFKCIYCTYPLLEGSTVRMRSIKSVVDEIEDLKNRMDINHFFFVDSVFNYPIDYCGEICSEIIKRKLNIKWSAYFKPKNLNEELVKLFKESGCTSGEFGIESCSNKILAILKKDFNTKHIEEARNLFKKYNMKFAVSLMFGSPEETKETINETFNFLEKIKPDAIIGMVGIRIYPDSELSKIALDEGIIQSYDELTHKPKFYISKHVADFLEEYLSSLTKDKMNWIIPGMHERMDEKLFEKLRDRGIKGPLWELI